MSFIWMRMKNHFNSNGFALSLALKQRLGATRKRPNKKFPFILLSTDYLTFPSGKLSKSPVSSSITPLSLQILENKAFIWFHFKRKQRPNADSQTGLQFRTEGLLAFWSAGRRKASCWPRPAGQKAKRLWVQDWLDYCSYRSAAFSSRLLIDVAVVTDPVELVIEPSAKRFQNTSHILTTITSNCRLLSLSQWPQ